MRQAFPVGALNNLASLFDGSNQVRGQLDAANAGLAQEKMRAAKRQNDMLDYSNAAQTSALLAGLDSGRAEQYANFAKNGGLSLAQSVGSNGANLPAGSATSAVAAIPDFYDEAMQQRLMRGNQQFASAAALGGDMRDFGANQVAYERLDRENAFQDAAVNSGSTEAANRLVSIFKGEQYKPYSVNSNGLLVNTATGAVDASNPMATAEIQNIAARTGLVGAQTTTEGYQQGKYAADTQKTIADTSKSLASISDLSPEVMKLYSSPKLGEDGSPVIGVDGKPVMVFDTAGFARDQLNANENRISQAQAFAMRNGGAISSDSGLGGLFNVNASVGGMVNTGMKIAQIIKSGVVKTPNDLKILVQNGQVTADEAAVIARTMKASGQ